MAKLTSDELIEAFKELTLIELSDFVKKFEEVFEVSAAAPVAVARTRGLGHQVERGRALGAREGGVVHAQEPEHPEGHRAHGHHVGKGDPAAQEGLAAVRLGEHPFQVLAHRRGEGGEQASRLGWVLAGCCVAAAAAPIVNVLL